MANKQDEFYVGYYSKAPAKLSKLMRSIVLMLIAFGLIVASLLVMSQKPFYPSLFEFGTYRHFEGTIQEKPYPMLLVKRPGEAGELPAYSRYYLVGFGKFGAEEAVKGMDNKQVKLQGSLVYRDNQTMVEIVDGTIEMTNEESILPSLAISGDGEPLGTFSLTGEIVDSKCFLGVMNPGNLKPHKACAIRCISGGVPPVFLVKDVQGFAHYYLLVSENGQMVNKAVLNMVAEPVKISGTVIKYGDLLVLKANPKGYELL